MVWEGGCGTLMEQRLPCAFLQTSGKLTKNDPVVEEVCKKSIHFRFVNDLSQLGFVPSRGHPEAGKGAMIGPVTEDAHLTRGIFFILPLRWK